jgi:membrane protein YdbS with pleckstrin-like domain
MGADDEKQMTPLDPGQLSVLRVSVGAAASVLLTGVLVVDLVWRPLEMVPPGLVSGAAGLLLLLAVIFLPARRYRSWGYRMDEEELQIKSGLWLRMHTIVPFGRVQHIDVAQGPLERRFGVGTLILHTAGTRNSAVPLPGLAFEEAGRIRDVIRSKIRQDLI